MKTNQRGENLKALTRLLTVLFQCFKIWKFMQKWINFFSFFRRYKIVYKNEKNVKMNFSRFESEWRFIFFIIKNGKMVFSNKRRGFDVWKNDTNITNLGITSKVGVGVLLEYRARPWKFGAIFLSQLYTISKLFHRKLLVDGNASCSCV